MTKAERFFSDRAGYSYDPRTETPEEGKARGARRLAAAEAKAKSEGMWFTWEHDDQTNRTFTDKGPEYLLWFCLAYVDSDNPTGAPEVKASVSGVDFGADNAPNDGTREGRYARVVEAELALEVYGEDLPL